MKTVVITQSNYIPWKGYFDQINMADVLVLYDDMQYTRRDWRNRNKIKTAQELLWLTVPVEVKGKFTQKINETKIAEKDWAQKHFKTIVNNYSKARYFNILNLELEDLYRQAGELEYLSEVNLLFINWINKKLGINTEVKLSSEYVLTAGKTERLVDLCKQIGAQHYLSGPAAKDYLDLNLFHTENISVTYMDYADYPEYEQLHGEFRHDVTILDLLLNTGVDAVNYMKSFKHGAAVVSQL